MQNLLELKYKLVDEKERLEYKLKEIDKELNLISETLKLINRMNLIKEEKSTEYTNITFKKAILDLLEKYPEKVWVPWKVAKVLLKKGFNTKSKNFGNVVRASLLSLRKKGIIDGEKIKIGKQIMYQYSSKKGNKKERTKQCMK